MKELIDILNQKPKEIKSQCRTFLLPTEDECIHIIETGHLHEERRFLVIYEDAYQHSTGRNKLMSKAEIKEQFNIEI